MAKQEPYIAIPLAEKGFVSIGPSNPVRWYVERPDGSLIGPYADMADADNAAEDLTRQARADRRRLACSINSADPRHEGL